MENNQMNQFFNDPQSAQPEQQTVQPVFGQQPQPVEQPVFGQQPQQQAQQPVFGQQLQQQVQQPVFGQQRQQQVQQPVFGQQLQQQAQQPVFGQQLQQPVFGHGPINLIVDVEPTPEMKKKFKIASNIAVVGGGLIILCTILCIVINFLLLSDVNKIESLIGYASESSEAKATYQFEIIGEFVMLIISITFTVLAYFLRKSKRKAMAQVLLVFSVLFGLFFLFATSNSVIALTDFKTEISNTAVQSFLSANERAALDIFKEMANLSTVLILTYVVSTIGWGILLTGSILRTSVNERKTFVK